MNLILVAALLAVHAVGPDALAVSVAVSDRNPYVGQPVEVRVGVVAEDRRPELIPPKTGDFILVPLGDDFRRLESSTIGDVASVKNLFLRRFRVVPRRAGKLEVGPFRASLAERSGSTERITLNVKPPPPGRPAGFLGGVGRLAARMEVEPADVRLGDAFELRIVLEGPGALGSVEPPDLSRVAATGIRPTIDPLASDVVDEPPKRTLRLRVRPTAAGEVRISGPSVAWLDSRSGRYQTVAVPSVGVVVHAVPRFDPGTLAPSPKAEPTTSGARPSWIPATAGVAALGLAAACLARMRARRARRRARIDAVRDRVERAAEPELAEVVARAISDRLSLIDGIEQGEQTPAEVVARARWLGLPEATVVRVADVAAECERRRFDPTTEDAADFRRRASNLLDALGARRGRTPPFRTGRSRPGLR